MHTRIQTTLAKAKEMKDHIDQIVNKAKRAKADEKMRLSIIRDLRKRLPAVTVSKLSDAEFIARFDARTSGYTRITKLECRKGDGAEMAVIEFV
jgi:large subunit ribosomal protein L17